MINNNTTDEIVYPLIMKKLTETFKKLTEYMVKATDEKFSFDKFERDTYAFVMNLGKECVECFLQKFGTGDVGNKIQLPDRTTIKKLPHLHARIIQSVFGVHTLSRTVYGTHNKQAIKCIPLDVSLQLPESEQSYFLQELGQFLSVEMPYKTAQTTLHKFLPNTNVSVNGLEHINSIQGIDASKFISQQKAPLPESSSKLLVVSADGKGIPIRHVKDTLKINEHHTKRGPKPDRKKMAVVGAVYDVDPFIRTPQDILDALFIDSKVNNNNEKPKRPVHQNKRVTANLNITIDDIEYKGLETTFNWLKKEVDIRDPLRLKTHISITDGQPSLLEQRKRTFSDSWVDILDILHANSYLWEAAAVFHADDSVRQILFMKENVYKMLCGNIKVVVEELEKKLEFIKLSKSKNKTVKKVCSYLLKNEHRMKYDLYLKSGYPIASGIIEGACLHLVKDRMEGTGMHWTIAGAQSMLNMRSIAINNDWEEFKKFRIEKETKKLYPYNDLIAKNDWILVA